jgi:DNA-binding NtrC family response regulator
MQDLKEAISPPITVLIVEDEAFIRMDVADYLSDDQFVTIEAANADEAISILEHREDIEVVFTDVNMPGSIDGMELAGLVRQRWPSMSVVMTSGMVRPSQSALPGSVKFFEKPYDLSELSVWMRNARQGVK